MPTTPPEVTGPAARWVFLNQRGPVAIAHRGGAFQGMGENTLAAFESAYRHGFRYLETYLHATADGELVAFHTANLDGVVDNGATGRIDRMTRAELAAVTVRGDAMPTFVELVAGLPDDAYFVVEPKSRRAARLLALHITEHDLAERLCVASFSEADSDHVREQVGPELCTACGPWTIARLWLAARAPRRWWTYTGRVARTSHPCVQAPDTLAQFGHILGCSVTVRLKRVLRLVRVCDCRFVDLAHQLGLAVHVWTVNDAEGTGRMIDLGVDGVITDNPDTLAWLRG